MISVGIKCTVALASEAPTKMSFVLHPVNFSQHAYTMKAAHHNHSFMISTIIKTHSQLFAVLDRRQLLSCIVFLKLLR